MGQLITQLLSKLIPFDGSKTILGAWILGDSFLGQILAGQDFSAAIHFLLANPNKSGLTLTVVGLVHKALKFYFPAAPEL